MVVPMLNEWGHVTEFHAVLFDLGIVLQKHDCVSSITQFAHTPQWSTDAGRLKG